MSIGYITDPIKTKSRFYKLDEKTYYNTGDRARILDDGSLELMGRKDDTIKIRGFKVPLPLVEAGVRASISNVSSVVIHYLLNPETRQPKSLVAYVVCDNMIDRQHLCVFLYVFFHFSQLNCNNFSQLNCNTTHIRTATKNSTRNYRNMQFPNMSYD